MINDCRQIGSPLQAGLARLMGKAYCSSTDWEFNQQRHYREYHGSSVLLCELPPWQANYVVSAHESTRAEYDSSGESWNTSRTVSFYISCHHWTSTAVYEVVASLKKFTFYSFLFLPWKWANRPGIVTDVEMQENCKNKWAAVMKWSARIVVMCLHSDQAGTTWPVMVHCLLPPPPSPSHLVTVLPASSQC